MSIQKIKDELCSKADAGYKDFHSALIPGVTDILGVRVPEIRRIAKAYAGTDEGYEFLKELPHAYYDENMLHGVMIGYMRAEWSETEKRILDFLPYIDNWAVCDSLVSSLKHFFKDREKGYELIKELLSSDYAYTVRFALVSLLNYYVDGEYIDRILELVASVDVDEYYVKMAQAWLISVCLAKEYEKTVSVIENGILSPWVHNKSIQKAKESLRISKERKTYLNLFKVKE